MVCPPAACNVRLATERKDCLCIPANRKEVQVKITITKESLPGERRVAALPETVRKYIDAGFAVDVETDAAEGVYVADSAYEEAGARVISNTEELFAGSDLMLKVKQPCFNGRVRKHEARMLRKGSMLIAFLHPAAPANHEVIGMLRDGNITSFTMDGVPRISRAQSMDALTSMSTITGYKSVILAANMFPRFLPLLGTAIGVNPPANVLVIGAGVVGLQAIATARSLGASVSAVDIREDARKAAETLGAVVKGFDVPADLAVGSGGFTLRLPSEWLQKERLALADLVKRSDIVILSALVPGEVAPVLLTEPMVSAMKPGSVIVDVSIDQGGNCELTRMGETIVSHEITVCGVANIPGSVPVLATQLYAANLLHYVRNLIPSGTSINWEDDIVRHSLVTHKGKIVHEGTLKAMQDSETL